jgi:hypothetical protein
LQGDSRANLIARLDKIAFCHLAQTGGTRQLLMWAKSDQGKAQAVSGHQQPRHMPKARPAHSLPQKCYGTHVEQMDMMDGVLLFDHARLQGAHCC